MKAQGFHFRKQVPIERFVVDFACLRVRTVVEIDGEQHGFETGLRRDAARDARLTALGYQVLRFWNHEVDRQIDVVLDTIFARCAERDPHPSAASRLPPSPAGEGGCPAGETGHAATTRESGSGLSPSPAGEGGSREARDGWGPLTSRGRA